MNYQVIARKFRPQVFEEVVGQKPIVQTLRNAIELNRIGHAYLFSGPRGVGKTTTARILAKGLNCVKGPTVSPCNSCSSCQEIAAGRSMDVLEIDAASNTGVDSVRELRESARYAPSRDRYKIFIIDEVHMLSTSAFNALLKILEEPPSHVVFIMATTERHRVPATILSRCQQFIFRMIPAQEIRAHLLEIVQREGVNIDDRGLGYIVRAAEGSMRDAQSLLDQIIAFSGQKVVGEDVRDVLGFIPAELLEQTVSALADRDSRALLNHIGVVVDQGFNLQQYVREFIGRVRDLLLMKLGLDDKVLSNPEEKTLLKQQSDRFSEQDLTRFFDLLLELEGDLRYTSHQRFHLEVGFVKLAKLGYMKDIEEVLRDLRHNTSPAQGVTRPGGPAQGSQKAALFDSAPARRVPPDPSTSTKFKELFVSRVEDRSATTAVYLQKAERIVKTESGVEVLMSNETFRTILDSEEHRAILDSVASDLVGKPVCVSLIMNQDASAARGESKAKEDRPADAARAMGTAREEPLVKRFLEVFRGDIAQVKPGKGD
jgi:DNA polymerase-3 subunit gamma/tau